MSTTRIVFKKNKYFDGIVYHRDSSLVIKSPSDRVVVVGRISDDEFIPLDDQCLKLCEKYGFKYDHNLILDDEKEIPGYMFMPFKAHKTLCKIYQPWSGVVFNSSKLTQLCVIGRIEKNEFIPLDTKTIEICKKYGYKYDEEKLQELINKKRSEKTLISSMGVVEAKDPTLACVICQTNQVQTINMPCMHACYCSACSKDILKRFKTCPKCRGNIDKISVFYI